MIYRLVDNFPTHLFVYCVPMPTTSTLGQVRKKPARGTTAIRTVTQLTIPMFLPILTQWAIRAPVRVPIPPAAIAAQKTNFKIDTINYNLTHSSDN